MRKTIETLEELLARYVTEQTDSFQDFDRLTVNSIGRELTTPLHMACNRDAIDDVRILLRGGADVNARDGFGMTPLMFAVYSVNLEMVNLLLEAGADPYPETEFGGTALEIAKSATGNDLLPIIKALRSKMTTHH
jgi:ankyrin repeat protein